LTELGGKLEMLHFYHVDRSKTLRAGEVVNLEKIPITDETDHTTHFISSMFPDGITRHGWNYLINRNRPTPKKDLNGIIEILAEQIRRSHYPHRLSRFQAFFVCKTIQEAENFINSYPITLPDQTEGCQGNIWEVASENVEFESDYRWLSLGNCWLDALSNLHNYWQGIRSSSPLWEVLLKPPIRVVKKVKELP
jgi:hypothetical protein